jgi:hypothetical protein
MYFVFPLKRILINPLSSLVCFFYSFITGISKILGANFYFCTVHFDNVQNCALHGIQHTPQPEIHVATTLQRL